MVRRVDDARQVLAEIARFNALPEARVKVIENMDLRSETNLPEQLTSLTFDYALLVKPPLRHLTVPLVLVWFFNSLASCFFIWVPLYISENSKNISGASEHLFLADGFGVGTLMAMGDLAGALLLCSSVEFADRKMLMRLGLAALALLLAGLGVWNVAPVLLTLLPVSTAVRSVVLTLLYTYTPEVFPTLIRTTALGLCSSFHRLAPVIGHLLAALAYTNSFALMALASSALYVAALIAALLLPYESRNAPLGDAFHREVVQQRHDE
jgi:putative MFS transporter